jgi:hypothetical protein
LGSGYIFLPLLVTGTNECFRLDFYNEEKIGLSFIAGPGRDLRYKREEAWSAMKFITLSIEGRETLGIAATHGIVLVETLYQINSVKSRRFFLGKVEL